MNDPLWNKGTAFSVPERDRLGLKGLLPPVIKTIEEQRDGFLRKMRELKDPVDQVGGVRVRVRVRLRVRLRLRLRGRGRGRPR